MISDPKVESRNEQHYAGIRTQVPMTKMKNVIPQLLGEIFTWLDHRGIRPSGAPFIRYHVIDMKKLMDIELGVPVASPVEGDDRVSAGILPSGRYAALVYRGVKNGIKGNKALLDWGAENGLVWDRWDDKNGDAFGGRYETFLTDPAEEPSPAKWDTEVAILLANFPPR